MTGHSEVLNVVWADAELEGVSIDYDAVVLSLAETATGNSRRVRCEGYIGYQLLGFWDEVVIASARIVEKHAFLSQCIEALERRYPSGLPVTGQAARNRRSWALLVVTLSDGAELLVAATNFEVL